MAVPLAWSAWFEHGVFWPDEILQTLEQGHRFAFGYGLVPWEFRDGVRSWLVPGAIGLVMKGGALAGVQSGLGLARLVKSCIALGTVAGGYATMRLAERIGGLLAALLAGLFYATNPLLVYFGARCFTDTVSIPIVAFGVLLLSAASGRAAVIGAGFLIGLSVVVRTQNALVVVGALAVLTVARQWRRLGMFVPGVALGLSIGGALDWLTWGAPFVSIVRYVRFNLHEGANPGWGDEPLSYYATTYFHAIGWPLLVLAVGAAIALPRARAMGAFVVLYVFAHEMIRLKQARLLLPVMPLFLAMAGIGVALALRQLVRSRRLREVACAGLAAALGLTSTMKLASASFASMGDLGMGATPAWHFDEPATILFSRVGQRSDACGVIYYGRSGHDWGHTGTYSYLHKDVPLFHARDSELAPFANYIVAPHGASRIGSSYESVDSVGPFELYRRPGACLPKPSWYSRDSER